MCACVCVCATLRLSICRQTCIHTTYIYRKQVCGGNAPRRRALLGAIINSSLTYNYGHPETTGNRFSLIVEVVLLLFFGLLHSLPFSSSLLTPSLFLLPFWVVGFGSLGTTHVNLKGIRISRRICVNQYTDSFSWKKLEGTLMTLPCFPLKTLSWIEINQVPYNLSR